MTSPTLRDIVADHRMEGRKLLLPFVTCGYPNPNQTVPILGGMERGGASIAELGVPFSDPLADGPTIQMASTRALQNGVTLKGILETVQTAKQASVGLPIVLMGYANPILAHGEEQFLRDARASGVDALIIPDYPLEELERLNSKAKAAGIDLIPLLAPTSTSERIRRAAELRPPFVYAVSVTGVTGARKTLPSDLSRFCATLREHLGDIPFVIGFGIKTAEQARICGNKADGIVVGSALIEKLKAAEHNPEKTLAWVTEEFVRTLREALDSLV